MLGIMLGGALAAGLITAMQRPRDGSAGVMAEAERWLELMGLGLQQVTLAGYRYTPDGDIFDAIDLSKSRTLLSFDSAAVQSRIERLPWVDRASIERVLPDRLDVRVTERTASAVWALGPRQYLIDGTGRVLGPVPQGVVPGLPRVAGEGAAQEAGTLLTLLAEHPAIARRVEISERIGQRRWRLRLAGGSVIELPATGVAEALARVAAADRLAPSGASVIDLRVAGRTLVRQSPGRLEGAVALDALLSGGI